MKIVTVSRLVGSYGDEIASLVAQKMGLELIGRRGLHEMALRCDPQYTDACEVYETEHGPGFFERLFFDRPPYKSLFESLTLELASRGNVVIIGRGAQIVLQDIPGVFNARLVAPLEVRIRRIEERLKMDREDTEEYVLTYDHDRETLIRLVFGKHQDEPLLYDMIFNTTKYSAESGAEIVVEAISRVGKVQDEAAVKERLRNMALAKKVETLIRKKLTSAVARNVEITCESAGVITIKGRIGDKTDKDRVEKLVSEHPGVTSFDNQLKVLQLSF